MFGLGRAPGQFPEEVLLIVLCVVTLAAALQAAGGLDLWYRSQKRRCRHPRSDHAAGSVDLLSLHLRVWNRARLFAAADHRGGFTKGEGAARAAAFNLGHRIAEAAVTASPMSAATAGMVALLSKSGRFGLTDILLVCIPSTLLGVLAGARGEEDGRGTRGRSGLSTAARPWRFRQRGEYQKCAPSVRAPSGRSYCSSGPW